MPLPHRSFSGIYPFKINELLVFLKKSTEPMLHLALDLSLTSSLASGTVPRHQKASGWNREIWQSSRIGVLRIFRLRATAFIENSHGLTVSIASAGESAADSSNLYVHAGNGPADFKKLAMRNAFPCALPFAAPARLAIQQHFTSAAWRLACQCPWMQKALVQQPSGR